MAYQFNALGVLALSLLRGRPMHGYEMVQPLVSRHADRIVRVEL